jgi:hypothetical protein
MCGSDDTKPRKTPTWLAFDVSRPLIHVSGDMDTLDSQEGTKADPVTGEHTLYGLLTTEPNADVARATPRRCPSF